MSGALGLFVLLSCLLAVAQCEYCTTRYKSWSDYSTEYCSYDCCGDWPNEYCCGLYTWVVVVVSVIGGLIFLSCVIAVICCVVKQQGHRGQVVQPAPGVTTVAYTTPGVQPYNYGNQQPPPPVYGHPGPQPPMYSIPGQSGQDPAYPPPSAPTAAKY